MVQQDKAFKLGNIVVRCQSTAGHTHACTQSYNTDDFKETSNPWGKDANPRHAQDRNGI